MGRNDEKSCALFRLFVVKGANGVRHANFRCIFRKFGRSWFRIFLDPRKESNLHVLSLLPAWPFRQVRQAILPSKTGKRVSLFLPPAGNGVN
jgi:hypothetical protein